MKTLLVALLTTFALTAGSRAAFYVNENFATYANGALVGQNGWTQSGDPATNPLQISNGKLVLAGNTEDNQDAIKTFATPSSAVPGTAIYMGFQLQVTGRGNNNPTFTSSYFAALQDQNATPFFDARIGFLNVDNVSYQVAARINGERSNPYTSTTESFLFGTDLISFVLGLTLGNDATPDTLQFWMNPTSLASAPAFTVTNSGTSITGGFQALLLSQFGFSSDVAIQRAVVADTYGEAFSVVAIPEPSSVALLLAAAAGAGAFWLRRRRQS